MYQPDLYFHMWDGDRPFLDIRVGDKTQHMLGSDFDIARIYIPSVEQCQLEPGWNHPLRHEFWIECDGGNVFGCSMNCNKYHIRIENKNGLAISYELPSERDAEHIRQRVSEAIKGLPVVESTEFHPPRTMYRFAANVYQIRRHVMANL